MKKYIIIGVVIALMLFIIFLLWLYINRFNIIFPQVKYYQTPQNIGVDFTEITFDVGGIKTISWEHKGQPNKPSILYFHGNGEVVSGSAWAFNDFIKEGYTILLAEYPGYSISEGKTTEENAVATALKNYQYLQEQGHKEIILYGFSIGTGVASELASIVKPNYMILEAPFSSIADVGKYWFKYIPTGFLLRNVFQSDKFLAELPDLNLLIIHSKDDRVVHYDLGQKLFNSAITKNKKFVTFTNAGHGGLKANGSGKMVLEWLRENGK